MLSKLRSYQYIFYVFIFLIIVIFLLSKNYNRDVNYDDVLSKTNNILMQEPVGVNYSNDASGIYIPNGFDLQEIENGFYLENRESAISIYTGLGVDQANNIVTSLNPDLNLEAEINPTDTNGNYYLGLWDYNMENSSEEYLELVILKKDFLLASVFPKSKASIYSSESGYIFNSIKEI